MAQVAFGEEGEGEEEGCDGAAGDEEGFQVEGAHVGDVGDGLGGLHGGVLRGGGRVPLDEHG